MEKLSEISSSVGTTEKQILKPRAHGAGISFQRHFTTQLSGRSPLDSVEYVKSISRIVDADGKIVFEMADIEAPKEWSQLAIDIVASKYFRKAGVPGTRHEVSVRQVIGRIARTLARSGEQYGYFAKKESEIFEDELSFLLVHQMGAFNSPVWFNLGLYHEYGITGQGGSYAYDSLAGKMVRTENAYSRPQCSACFIQSAEDDLMELFELMKNEAKLFKYGSGTGTNFSKIRARQERLSGGGTSSGLMSFLEVFDRGAGATKSGGTTRRAAKMVCLDMDHPEITDFITWKMREEKKVAALIAAGYSADFNGEAYRTVAGQNSNNSVRVSDEFMRLVEQNGKWNTRFRTTGEICETFDANNLWRMIAESAWSCADPGVQFDTTINDWHTCIRSDRIHASNPCSEYMFLDNSACNLASLNLVKFLNSDGDFDCESFRQACRVFVVAQEILVALSSYPTLAIAQNSHDYRPLGLGYANLGTLLMLKGIAYDSDEARAWAAAITALMSGRAYAVSAELAKTLGSFAGFEMNREAMLRVMNKHKQALDQIDQSKVANNITTAARHDWEDALRLGEQYGYRNAQTTVLAPTGTIGLLMDCDTTGVEPDFALVKFKKLAGGGSFKIANQSVPAALKNLGYGESEIKDIVAYLMENMTVEGAPHLKSEHLPVFDCANRCGERGTRFIAPMGHVKMMAAVQPFLSGAISKTVNLPNETSVQEIEDIYYQAWKMGIKAIAIYRDGCKFSQPLSTTVKSPVERDKNSPLIEDNIPIRRKLPSKRHGFTQEATVGGHKVYLRTGEYDNGELGEIFIDIHKEGASYRSMMNCFAIAVSLGLQHGVPLKEFVDKFTFTRFEPSGTVTGHANVKMATSIVDYIFRVLGFEYLGRTDFLQIKNPIDSPGNSVSPANPGHSGSSTNPTSSSLQLAELMGDAPPCSSCGHTTVRNGSCYRCLNCGNSMGCS